MKLHPLKSERLQKWGLFCLLTGSLGFSLSMNPDHFNQIASHRQKTYSMDLAATQAEERTSSGPNVETKDKKSEVIDLRSERDQAPGEEEKPKKETLIISSKNGGLYKAHITEDGKGSRAKLEALEGSACVACDATILLNSSIDKIKDLNEELSALIERKTGTPKDLEDKKILAQKKGEATEVDIEKWAEKCEESSKENVLSCHSSRIVELSKYLKNTAENEKHVTEYFKKYMMSSLKAALYARTLNEVSAENCEGNALYATRTSRVGCLSSDRLEEASEMTEEITRGLRTQNGKETARLLMKLKAGSFSAQLRNSQLIAREAQAEGNLTKFSFINSSGSLNPDFQMKMLDQSYSGFATAINEMDGTASQRSAIETMMTSQFYNPVSNMLNDMKNFLLQAPTNQNGVVASQTALDFTVPSLGGDLMVPGGMPHTPGMPGNVPQAVYLARSQAPVRGSGLATLPMSQQSMQMIGKPVTSNFFSQTNSMLNMHPNTSFAMPKTETSYNPAMVNARTGNARQ